MMGAVVPYFWLLLLAGGGFGSGFGDLGMSGLEGGAKKVSRCFPVIYVYCPRTRSPQCLAKHIVIDVRGSPCSNSVVRNPLHMQPV